MQVSPCGCFLASVGLELIVGSGFEETLKVWDLRVH
jgi:hypothetical protein